MSARASGVTMVAPLGRSTFTSGVMPSGKMCRPFGVSHSSTASRRAEPSGSMKVLSTVPVPNERTPTTLARPGVLQGPGHDLGRTGRAVVDQHDQRGLGGDPAGR